jgi:hypothetical protein
MDIEKQIAAVYELLERADGPNDRSAFAAHKSLGAVILSCAKLVEIIQGQQSRIEQLEDVLQNHLETTPRRRPATNETI